MRFYEHPQLSGTSEEKINQLNEYLRGLIDELNYNQEVTNATEIWEQTLKALTSLTTENCVVAGQSVQKDSTDVLRALILQCFAEVIKIKNRADNYVSESYFLQSDHSDKTEKIQYKQENKEDDYVSYGQLLSVANEIKEEIESLKIQFNKLNEKG